MTDSFKAPWSTIETKLELKKWLSSSTFEGLSLPAIQEINCTRDHPPTDAFSDTLGVGLSSSRMCVSTYVATHYSSLWPWMSFLLFYSLFKFGGFPPSFFNNNFPDPRIYIRAVNKAVKLLERGAKITKAFDALGHQSPGKFPHLSPSPSAQPIPTTALSHLRSRVLLLFYVQAF